MVGNCSRAQEWRALQEAGWTGAQEATPNKLLVQQSVGQGERIEGAKGAEMGSLETESEESAYHVPVMKHNSGTQMGEVLHCGERHRLRVVGGTNSLQPTQGYTEVHSR